jgi:hypothetical protein
VGTSYRVECHLKYFTRDLRLKNLSASGTLTSGALTSGRVALVGTAGLITDDAGITYDAAANSLTATTFLGALNGTVGATTPAAGTFTNVTATGVVAVPDGSAATPSVKVGDEQNGLFSPGANVLGFGVAGGERARITSLTFQFSRSSGGNDNRIIVQNTSNTASSMAGMDSIVAGATAADPYNTFTITGVTTWSYGADNSDSDSFKISNNATLGTNDRFTLTTGGDATIAGTLAVNGASITTDDTTFACFNTNATTVNAFGAATTLNMGNASGTNTLAGLLSLTQGQIQFPAAQNSSSNANTLDDYEEGTYTPAPEGTGTAGTPTGTFAGHYIKIGSQVWVTVQLVFTALTGMVGNLIVRNLPFTAISGSSSRAALAVAFRANFTNDFPIVVRVVENANDAVPTVADLDNTAVAIADLSATTNLYFSGCYRAAA